MPSYKRVKARQDAVEEHATNGRIVHVMDDDHPHQYH